MKNSGLQWGHVDCRRGSEWQQTDSVYELNRQNIRQSHLYYVLLYSAEMSGAEVAGWSKAQTPSHDTLLQQHIHQL